MNENVEEFHLQSREQIARDLGGLITMASCYGYEHDRVIGDLDLRSKKPMYSKPKEIQSEEDKQQTLSKAEAKRERKRLKKEAQLLKCRREDV